MAMCNITGHLYDASGEIIQYGIVTFQLQQDMVYSGQKVVPFTISIDLSTTSGYIDITVFPTVNASPSGIAYKMEFDPDPADTGKPLKSKAGYFRNYITVPDQASASLGSFVSALRGQPAANYMPIGGTVGTIGDDITLGTGTSTNKRIIANMSGSSDPEIRFNNSTGEWEFSNDGSAFQGMLQGGGGSVGGDLSGTVGSATVEKIQGSDVSTTAPSSTGQVLRWNNSSSQWEPSTDGTSLTTSATNLTTGTVPLARLSGITNTEISASAGIAWSKISTVGFTIPTTTVLQLARLGIGAAADATGVLRIAGQYWSDEYDAGNSGTAISIDWNNGNTQLVTLTDNCTFTLSNPHSGAPYMIILVQDATGSRTVTWPASVKWPGGVAPTLSTPASSIDVVVLKYSAAGGGIYIASSTTNFS